MTVGLVLTGCGMPRAPLPPTLNLADPVTDLGATRAGDQVSLAWTMPKKNTDKLLLKGNLQVHVCRREGPSGPCAPAGDLQLAPEAAGAFIDTLPAALTLGAPRELNYFVEIRNANRRSAGMSNPAVVIAGEAPEPVTGLRAEVRKEGVLLHWAPANQEAAHAAIRLHRRLLTAVRKKKSTGHEGLLEAPPEPAELHLLVEASGPSGGSFDRAMDKTIRFGETYENRAQRVTRVTVDGRTLELAGQLSAPVQVGLLDVFPPRGPGGAGRSCDRS